MTNNKQQTAVEWLSETLRLANKEAYAEIYDDINKAKEMEIAGKEMSYADGYSEGYKRCLELIKWNIEKELNKLNKETNENTN
jgi:hypothetical protein